MPLYGNFGEDHRDENDRRPLRREDESPAAERAIPMPNYYYRSVTERRPPQTDDLATRVAADLFARIVVQGVDLEKSNWEFYPDEKRYAEDAADVAVKCGRIFAEAVAKEGK